MSTGLTTGPYSLAAGSVVTLNDPATWSTGSVSVQLQNASGFVLTVQSGGDLYTIAANTAATIPANNGQSLQVSVTSSIGNQSGQLTVVWLLNGQDAPINDGPLFNQISNQRLLGTYSTGFSTISTISTDQSFTFYFYDSLSTTTSVSLSVVGVQTSITYFQGQIPLTGYVGTVTVSISGSLDSSIKINVGTTPSSGTSLSTTVVANSLPYNQPVTGDPVDTVSYGGSKRVDFSITNNTTTGILSAPTSGLAYRLHSWNLFRPLTSANTTAMILLGLGASYAYGMIAGSSGLYQQNLNGLLTTNLVGVYNFGTGSTISGSIYYDIVTSPTIS